MAVFSSTEKMYEVLGSLFEMLLKDQVAGPKFLESNIIIRFDITDPAGQLWITNIDGGKVICGSADLKPTIDMHLSGDTCHKFWLQQIAMPVALAKGLIKAKGPMPKVIKLLPLLKPAYREYPALAKKHGLPV